MQPAIRIEGISKQYRIGTGQRGGYRTLRESVSDSAAITWQLLNRFARNKAAAANVNGQSAHGHANNGDVTNGHIGAATQDGPNTFWALRDVSFDVQPGEVVGIIGRNGAGKSTLLKILSRITEPTKGRIVLNGRVASLLEVGTGFHPELTGRENIFMNGSILGMSRREIQRKFDEIVDFSGIEQFIDTPVKRYSSGMYVRLAFAVAAHLEPEILIIDEVLAVGDAEFQKKCLGKMRDVADHGRTVLFVSHNLPAVQGLCTRAVLLQSGQLIQDASSRETIDTYQSLCDSRENTGASVDLTSRTNSYHDGKLLIKGASLYDHRGQPTTTFECSHPLQLRIDVEGLSNIPSALVGAIFKSNADQWLANINTGMVRPEILEVADQQTAILELSPLPFVPGQYHIDLSVAIRGVGRIDFVEHALDFTVVPYDLYGTGYTVSDRDGIVYLNANWKLLRSERLVGEAV